MAERRDLIRASLRGALNAPRLVIERQHEGDVYRLLLLDGELLDAVRRRPPHVVGDGRSSIRELIAAENERRLAAFPSGGMWLLRADLDCVVALRAQGLNLRAVPAAGALVRVKNVTNQNRVDDNESVRDAIGPGLAEDAARAARAVGIRLAGVDVVTPDAGRPLRDAGGVVLEVNGRPGFHHHYLVANPEPSSRVAIPVLRKLLGEP